MSTLRSNACGLRVDPPPCAVLTCTNTRRRFRRGWIEHNGREGRGCLSKGPATPPKFPARAADKAEGSGSVPDRYLGNEARSGGTADESEDRWYRDAPSPYQAEGVFSFPALRWCAPRGR